MTLVRSFFGACTGDEKFARRIPNIISASKSEDVLYRRVQISTFEVSVA